MDPTHRLKWMVSVLHGHECQYSLELSSWELRIGELALESFEDLERGRDTALPKFPFDLRPAEPELRVAGT